MTTPLWPNDVQLDCVGVTGGYSSGKTLFLLSIAEPSRTLIYDLEKSSSNYAKVMPGLTRIDLPDAMMKKFPKGYTQKVMFENWLKHVRSIPPGKYDVIAVDPINELEPGLVDYVASRYADYGFKYEEAFRRLEGVFWQHVKDFWKQVKNEIMTKCQTLAFSTHLKREWRGGKPTSKELPKGKNTLMELASLYLFLNRDFQGKEGVIKPAAHVLKSRLIAMVDGEPQPVLPPRLPEATPKAIRSYISTPPNYDQLRPEELEQEKELTELDRLELEAEIATEHRLAQEAAAEAAAAAERTQDAKDRARNRLRPKNADAVTKEELTSLLSQAKEKGLDQPLIAAIRRDIKVDENVKLTPSQVAPKLTRVQFQGYVTTLQKKG